MTISFRGETAGSVGKINLNPRRKEPIDSAVTKNIMFCGETAGSASKRDLNIKTPQEETSIFSMSYID